ncbi:MAG: sigma-70 family RNA polymerase sigma factor [Clostridia bacterium]|nr:sigma-70 family RNA polymerase sigma factor [Clostridia bacterium]
MDDNRIIDMYFARSEDAIAETDKKYGRYCRTIAYNILFSHEDAEECVSDTYMKAWDSMPPQKPLYLAAFLGKITRNLSLNRFKREHAQKRSGGVQVVFDELAECIPDPSADDDISDEIVLKEALNSFLAALSPLHRVIFVRRYWYLTPLKEIAAAYGCTEGSVKSILSRTRTRFRKHLEKEGIRI